MLKGNYPCPNSLASPDGRFSDDDSQVAPGGSASALNLTLAPNPTRDQTFVGFTLDADARVTLRVLDLTGRVILLERTDGYEGENVLPVLLPNCPSGVYVVEVQAGALRDQRRLVVQGD